MLDPEYLRLYRRYEKAIRAYEIQRQLYLKIVITEI